MMLGLPFDLVELVPCPGPPTISVLPLREMAFRQDAWLPDEIDTLRIRFAADEDLAVVSAGLDRPLAGVQSKLGELGLRRNSTRPWSDFDRAYLAQHYGTTPASAIAAALGRTPAAVYAQAGVDGLTEGNPPEYTAWEIAQVREGYGRGVPVAQLGVLIGPPVSGIASLASKLGIKHANAPSDWTTDEQQRALALAEEGRSYRQIAMDLVREGFPQREHGAVGQALRKLGHGRGWGRPWLEEEKALLRQAYANGDSLTPLQQRLGRTRTSVAFQAGEMGLQGTHARPNGWRTEPNWTEEEIAILRRDYGRVPTGALAAALGREKGGVYNKAWSLGLVHGWIRAFSADEERAIRIARDHGLSLTDLAAALNRDTAVVSKHAIRMGVPFSTRTVRASRTRCAQRAQWTLADILMLANGPPPAAGEEALPAKVMLGREAAARVTLVALPGLPSMTATLLAGMHKAGLLAAVGQCASTVLVGPQRS